MRRCVHLHPDRQLDLRDFLVDLTDLESAESLEEAGAVIRARGVGELEHLLGELAVELSFY